MVTLQLDKERHLDFTLGAIVEFEKMANVTMANLPSDVGLEHLMMLLYCGLKWEDETLTLEQVGKIIQFNRIPEMNKAIMEAIAPVK